MNIINNLQKNIKGIIFDCDGVLVDSEPFSCGVWKPVLAKRGINIGEGDFKEIVGKNMDDAIEFFFKKYSFKGDKNEIAIDKEEEYFNHAKGNLKTFPGTIEFIEKALELGLKICVASSGSLEKIHFNLNEGGLSQYFTSIISCEDVKIGKPAPDLFLAAAKRIMVNPEECIVVEDSLYGVQAAKAASMYCIAITTSLPAEKLHEADIIADTLEEVSLEDLLFANIA
jgi:HAD superfamily hydrolase (TIGR01509 family)